MPKNWKRDLKPSDNVVVNGQVLESKGHNGLCKIDLPLNSNQAGTLFEWKLKILHIGSRIKTYSENIGIFGEYDNVTRNVDNEIKLGISSIQDDIFLSNRFDFGTVQGRGTIFKFNKEKIRVNISRDDIFSFQFDCTSGTLFAQKNDECRILLGFVKNVQCLPKNTFFPCVKLECPGDRIELLSAGSIHNSIYSTPISNSSTSNKSSVWFMLFAACIVYYSNYIYKNK